MKTKIKNDMKGITLIALVITIIVLLILAGISIAMLTGQNGILTQSQNAKEQTENSNNWEQVKLAVTAGKLENITKGTDLNTAIQNELRKTDSAATVTGETEEKEITYFGKVYNVNVKTGATSDGEDEFQKPDYNEAMLSLKQKDYVLYDTGVEGVGKILCQVLYEASSEYGLQIIPVDCIKKNDEYVQVEIFDSKTKGLMPGGSTIITSSEEEEYKDKYNTVIEELNSKAMEYANTNYIVDARCIGSNPKAKNSENKNMKLGKRQESTELKDEDDNYTIDYENLSNLNMLNTAEAYWMASRYNEQGQVYFSSDGIHFKLRIVEAESEEIYGYNNNGLYDAISVNSFGFRPAFLLKGNLQIISGDGQQETPYELGV